MKPIFVYHDYAHHNASLWFALTRRYGNANVQYIDANDIKNGILQKMPAAFIMPGGASRYVADKLNGAGNAAILRYVADGGRYIGICAGAYYACKTINWKNGEQTIAVKNELALFSGASQGPIAEFCTGTDTARIVTVETNDGRELPMLYWGGGHFYDVDESAVTVMARYKDITGANAAIISGAHGKGRWLLASPHPEFDDAAVQLMQFKVIDNRYDDIAKLPAQSGMTLDYFYRLIDEILE